MIVVCKVIEDVLAKTNTKVTVDDIRGLGKPTSLLTSDPLPLIVWCLANFKA